MVAFVSGAAVAAVVVLVIVFLRGGDDDGDRQAVGTATSETTPGATPAAGTTPTTTGIAGAGTPMPGLTATATPASFQDPDEALAAFVRDELESQYIGECPQELAPGEPPATGTCSRELYRSEELVTLLLGSPFSEFFGEAVVTRNEDGSWSLNLVPAPPLGQFEISVGSEAVVYGAGDCLNFREAPSASAEVRSCQIDGTKGRVVDGPVDADDHTWWNLEGLGWASSQYLAPVAE